MPPTRQQLAALSNLLGIELHETSETPSLSNVFTVRFANVGLRASVPVSLTDAYNTDILYASVYHNAFNTVWSELGRLAFNEFLLSRLDNNRSPQIQRPTPASTVSPEEWMAEQLRRAENQIAQRYQEREQGLYDLYTRAAQEPPQRMGSMAENLKHLFGLTPKAPKPQPKKRRTDEVKPIIEKE